MANKTETFKYRLDGVSVVLYHCPESTVHTAIMIDKLGTGEVTSHAVSQHISDANLILSPGVRSFHISHIPPQLLHVKHSKTLQELEGLVGSNSTEFQIEGRFGTESQRISRRWLLVYQVTLRFSQRSSGVVRVRRCAPLLKMGMCGTQPKPDPESGSFRRGTLHW